MKDFFQTILGEVKSGRMQKEEAIFRIRQLQAQMTSNGTLQSQAGSPAEVMADTGVLMLEPSWKEQAALQKATLLECSQHLVVLCELDHISERSIEELIKGTRCIKLHADKTGMDERFQGYALQLLAEVQMILKKNLKGSVLVQLAASSQSGQQLFAGLLGLLQTAEKENPKIVGQFIELEAIGLEEIIKKLNENSLYPKDKRIRYENGKRLVLRWNEMKAPETPGRVPWKDRGIYLITGGAGGLGFVFARDIARRVQEATLVLAGRSRLDEGKQVILEELKTLGAFVEYKQVDVSRKEEVSQLILKIRAEHGGIDGILHSAGVIQDRFMIHKTQEEFKEVIAPKVAGLVNLDQATKELDLDFFIFFSSIAGIMGNPGQADYAAANAFMDAYAIYRNSLVSSKERKGQTLSINWPLWKDGGMHADAETEKVWQSIGMMAMQTSNGVKALYDCLASGQKQVLVLEGDMTRLRKHLLEPQPQENVYVEETASLSINPELLLEKTLHQLKVLFGEVTKLSLEKIDVSEPLESYGIDSIMITRLNQKLQGVFGEISMTLFFEYQTLEAVAEYFIADYYEECVRWTGLGRRLKPEENFVPVSLHTDSEWSLPTLPKEESQSVSSAPIDTGSAKQEPIAIIGMSGRFPQAKNMEEYWSNLQEGKDCITEIPADRWKKEGFYSPDMKEAIEKGKSYIQSGGFVEDFADFDPLFFNISPREAMSMDPQERIFLEECWKAFEDAGYSRDQLAAQYNGRIGVFAGITATGFNLYGPKLWEQGKPIFPRTSFSSVANRISYLLNLKGPSFSVDTMCSSSLTAIHEACEHIHNGDCEIAIAGGVNLYLHPSNYVFLSTMRMLSPEGRCKSFGEGGNGFVPGEGAGVVLLKPLSRAIADKDHIYAVIRATSINHGGKTNGYTVPNPVAQGELIREALDKAGVNARTVSYIEAHGTGTELGDPIEITGLTQAFRKDTQDTGFCAIGSVKSNIGHLEAAAGIAGVAKIILQMKNRKMVPSLHAKVLNPNINFAKTPFTVQQGLAEWKRPILEENGEQREYPRIAGISSFGAGGSNAHIVLEEYISAQKAPSTPQRPVVIVLSAKSDEALKEQAVQLTAAIETNSFSDTDLVNAAYTLQIGREAMDERLAVVVQSVEELRNKLEEFIGGSRNIAQFYRGQVKRNQESLDVVKQEEALDESSDVWNLAEKYGRLSELWVKGMHVDWNRLYSDVQPFRISLPTYPFARERYWISVDEEKPASVAPLYLHPLLHHNTSVLSEQRFSSTFNGQEFYLNNSVVDGRLVLSDGACLEMARTAVEQSLTVQEKGQAGITLKDMVWTHAPVISDQPEIHIGLFPGDQGGIDFKIYSTRTEAGDPVLHCEGSAELETLNRAESLDIQALQMECIDHISPGGDEKAQRLVEANYGSEFQSAEQVYIGHGLVLAKLSLPSGIANTGGLFVLHPYMTSAALQMPLYLLSNDENIMRLTGIGSSKKKLPTAMDRLEIFQECPSEMWALVRYERRYDTNDKALKYDIDLCDEAGSICARMKGVSYKEAEACEKPLGAMMLQPFWKEQAANEETIATIYERHVVILCETDAIAALHVEASLTDVECITLQARMEKVEGRFETYAVQVFEKIQGILINKPKGKVLVQIVMMSENEKLLFSGLCGILKTAHKENPKFYGQLIEVGEMEKNERLIEILRSSSRRPEDSRIRFVEGKRWIPAWNKLEMPASPQIPWKNHGVYLLTGGAKGLGLIFAKEIARQTREVTLILTGRSLLTEDKLAPLEELKALGATVEYRQVDVTQKEAVVGLMEDIQMAYGGINGILHSAGIIKDNYIIKKTSAEFREVLAPKVAGLANLDQASKDMPLDFFILFSSAAGVGGNAGQSDYATANAFMDAYAWYRNTLVSSWERMGKTLSINWPLWKEGGMQPDQETEKALQNVGMYAMRTETGIRALYQSIACISNQAMVVEGDIELISRMMIMEEQLEESGEAVRDQRIGSEDNIVPFSANKAVSVQDEHLLREKTAHYLKTLLSSSIELPAYRIEEDTPLENYGVDSIKSMELTDQLEKTFDQVSKTIFFEYPNIRSLTEYFLKSHLDELIALFGLEQAVTVGVKAATATTAIDTELRPGEEQLRDQVTSYLKRLLSSSTGLPEQRIEEDKNLENYGVDSIKSMEITDQLEETFGSLSRTLLFEYPNIQSLTEYFLESHRDEISTLFSLEQVATVSAKADMASIANDTEPRSGEEWLRDQVSNYLKGLLSSSIGLPEQRIEEDKNLENYGVDSIKSMELTDQLEETFGSLSRTLLFEYPNIQSLTEYFLESHRDELNALFGAEQELVTATSTKSMGIVEHAKAPSPVFRHSPIPSVRVEPKEEARETGAMDIAVIGVSGKYPGAENIHEFWRNLQEGKDCITEVPKDRWDHELYFDKERNKPGKTYCKWGGFLNRIHPLDSSFFHLTPHEVSLMDPMEQLFLETIWSLLESAGYTREVLQKKHQSKVGVYVGATYHKYCTCDTDTDTDAHRVTSFGSVAVANPMSHYFNFQGPSISIDTMSSSSAVAVHMACESLFRGECQIAVAGGGNLLTSPKKYIESSQNQLIGSHEDSRSFADGDGYLPAEGVGAVLLKPLHKAEQDGDCILAVIKSTATNHGGHSNGYTVPNPNAQAQLVEENFLKAGIHPRTVSYVEAAANGSTLGDPIELVALKKSFQKFTDEQHFCAMGSVKSNIGHAEAASGISQLTKTILQLWHRKLVPTIKAEKLNPNLTFSNTPFYLQRELQEWKRPVIELEGEERECPLRATVSSFGAGGSNVHFILEEYIPSPKEAVQLQVADQTEVVVLSDINWERLKAFASQLLEYVERQNELSLHDIAFTLQTGREAMKCRTAIVASSREELLTGLRQLIETVGMGNEPGGAAIPIFIGEGGEDTNTSALLSGKVGEKVSQILLEERNLENIAMYWTQGGRIRWEVLHEGQAVRRILLPTSPF
ncbi:hybrid non-ribosomal peptide synthetase/type I polyketide synthase [Paenibacillus ottowii]|uniref:SDR family NAD(P)-dependent oxidoreductase n=1 Tax=Paenibacillus ottowii TaxID=2315729 RepID=A0ABY3BBA1_9BACL|nr:type I polyketide synthase [Paenibacillus ottowii]TQS00533.1 SDR family NAD(P)-dependent oxidoreductase [Paenibacillus ottowii]